MSVSAIGGAAGWFSAGSVNQAKSTSTTSKVLPHRFGENGPNDPLNQYVTADDRTVIKSSTGVDIRPDGGIVSPMSMSLPDYAAVLDSVGQLAADRANGNSSPLTSNTFAGLLGHFGYQGGSAASASSAQVRVDLLA
jgi:hypothetical protein